TCMSAKRAVAHLAAYKLGAIALPLSTLFGQETLDYRLRDAGAWVEELEHGLTPPFGSSYAGRPASRGPWWSATRHQEPVLSCRPWPPGGLLATDRSGQRLASCSSAAGGSRWRGEKRAHLGACTSGSRVARGRGRRRWRSRGGKGRVNFLCSDHSSAPAHPVDVAGQIPPL